MTVGFQRMFGQQKTAGNAAAEHKIGVSVYDQYDTFMSNGNHFPASVIYQRKGKGSKEFPLLWIFQNADQSQFTQNDQMENFIEEGCDLACINLFDRNGRFHHY